MGDFGGLELLVEFCVCEGAIKSSRLVELVALKLVGIVA